VPPRRLPDTASSSADLQAFGVRLGVARRLCGLTQAELAQRSGVSRALVVRAERGEQSISLDAALRLIGAVGGRVVLPEPQSPVVGGLPRPDSPPSSA
jgi:transcriptional regulator with XRE-family HTH domain